MDGWTSPWGTNYLGIVINSTNGGEIHRAVLEFIKLTKSHTGKYLAKVFADCLEHLDWPNWHVLCLGFITHLRGKRPSRRPYIRRDGEISGRGAMGMDENEPKRETPGEGIHRQPTTDPRKRRLIPLHQFQ
ncbi:hypothetical protein DFH09DRAFT_1086338 [Mycena vulgaris]|nr:hypothetical protein DFH09DRAFT_1086338 [Mycena vulgaris]